MDEKLIECKHIKKSFSNKSIIKGIDVDIYIGDCIAFIGENGCGKSTLLKIICGLDQSISGSVKMQEGLRITYIPDRFPKINMKAGQYITNIGLIANKNKEYVNKRKNELFSKFRIEEYENVSLKYLSKGTLQKIAIIQAILIDPDVLFMDEPLSGQDVNSQHIFVDAMKALLHKQVSLVFVCHEKLLLNVLAKKVFRVVDGKIQEQEKFISSSDLQCVKVGYTEGVIPEEIKELCDFIKVDDTSLRCYVQEKKCNRLLSLLLNYNYKIEEVTYEND